MERGLELQRWLAGRLQETWKRSDNGVWESRGERQHFVYSTVMCWVGFDAMVKGVEHFGLEGPVDRWRAVHDEIHSDVLENGYDAERGPSPRLTAPGRWTRARCSSHAWSFALRRRAGGQYRGDDP